MAGQSAGDWLLKQGQAIRPVTPHWWDGTTLVPVTAWGIKGGGVTPPPGGDEITPPVSQLTGLFWLHNRGNPEETAEAYAGAVAANVGLAPSVHLLSDGATLVCNFDSTITRTWTPEAAAAAPSQTVAALGIADWQAGVVRDIEGKGQPDAEALFWSELAATYGKRAILAPEPRTGTAVDVLIASLVQRGLQDWSIVRSATRSRCVQAAQAGLKAMWLTSTAPTDWASVATDGIYAVGLPPGQITTASLAAARAAGVKVWATGIGDVATRDTVTTAGVDGIVSRWAGSLALAPPPPPPPPPPPGGDYIVVGAASGDGGTSDMGALDTQLGTRMMGTRYYADASNYNSSGLQKIRDAWSKGQTPYLSVKPPPRSGSGDPATGWAGVGNGSQDTWINNMLTTYQSAAVAAGPDKVLWLCVHHEPDDDILKGTATYADFIAMQNRLHDKSKAFDRIRFGIVLMGYHEWGIGADIPISTIIPNSLAAKMDFFGVDVYENFDKPQSNGQPGTTWTPFSTLYFPRIKAWLDSVNPGCPWGQFETGVTARAFSLKPTWFAEQDRELKKNGGSIFLYFNSTLNSVAPWPMNDPNSPRLEAFRQMLVANKAIRDASAEIPPNAPTGLKSGTVTTTSVVLSWTAATVPTGGDPVTEYRVYLNGTETRTVVGTSVTLSGLTAATSYRVTVRAYNGQLSPASATLTVTTATNPPPPTAGTLMGMYSGNPQENPDEKHLALFGKYPDIATSYILNGSINTTYERARFQRGTSLILDLDPKQSPGTLTAVANETTAGLSYIRTFLDQAKAIQDLDRSTNGPKVWLAWAHEWEVKWRNNIWTNTSDAMWQNWAKSHSVFNREAHIRGLRTVFWTGGYSNNWTILAQVMAAMTVPCDAVSTDPYRSGGTATLASNWAGWGVNFFKNDPTWKAWGSPPIFVTEYGVNNDASTDASAAAFLTGVRQTMTDLGVTAAVYFNRNRSDEASNHMWQLDDGNSPQALAAYKASFLAGARL